MRTPVERSLNVGLTGVLALVYSAAAFSQAPEATSREVPARSLPIPMGVSPQMRAIIGRPVSPSWNAIPKSPEDWRSLANVSSTANTQALAAARDRLHVRVEAATMEGVHVYLVTPEVTPHENRNRLLIHLHGGCYVFGGGEAATSEAVLMAGFGGFRVVSIDYRMPPEAYFPAALDDAMTVWKHVLKTTPPGRMAVFGSSAGGALTLELVLRARQLGLPLPAAIAPGTPMADLTGVGDSFHTNAMVDNVLVAPEGRCDAAAAFYAHGHDVSDPLLSPVYGDLHGFPPAILTTGTRDLLLSNTVRVHRKLREAGVESVLEVYEGQPHAAYLRDDLAPESKEAFGEIATFLDRHLAR